MNDKLTDAYLHVISEAYTLKHPLAVTKKGQMINEVKDALKNGEECDGVICHITDIDDEGMPRRRGGTKQHWTLLCRKRNIRMASRL